MQQDGMPFHTLFAQQFDRSLLERLCTLATRIRRIAKVREGALFLSSLLSHKRAMLYFSQPSSRTFLSHLSACEILGMRTGSVRDAATSSELKGESKEDSVRTFSSYFDLVIMRSPSKGLAERVAWVLGNSERNIPIINAGSGKDQHPTQALLDIYTLHRSFETQGGIDNKTVVFVGDLLRGRTVRSLAFLLTRFNNVRQIFVAPKELQIKEDILKILTAHNVQFELSDNLAKWLPEADAVYMTRIQDEWDSANGESAQIDTSSFKLGPQQVAQMKPGAAILHPLPRRDEISTEVDNDPRAKYWRQMRNGMWIRTALIAATFGCETAIDAYYAEHVGR
ncbi:MAG: aspartate carbamoyltransferase [Kiritimatiellae bacterium]|nr:aspartate carbamoyltransferase [Kiritimatiellia bacterium]